MKRTDIQLLAALLVLGIAFTQLPIASAQPRVSTNKQSKAARPAPAAANTNKYSRAAAATRAATNKQDKVVAPKPSAEQIQAKIADAIKAVYPTADVSEAKKDRTIASNDVYTVDFTVDKKKI